MFDGLANYISEIVRGKKIRVNGQDAQWRKVANIKVGEKIAVVGKPPRLDTPADDITSKVKFDEIVSIKRLSPERVWDIEVEDTHNFVANGILAHNTYMSGNVGIGTTGPGYKLEVAGTGYFSQALSLGTQASTTAHAVRADRTLTAGAGLTGGGDLTADRTFNVGAGSNITIDADTVGVISNPTFSTSVSSPIFQGNSAAVTFGNASYGTTIAGSALTVSPTAWTATPTISGLITATSGLTANGTATFNSNSYFPGSGIWNTSGNVGIGTTGPTEKLTINGKLAFTQTAGDETNAGKIDYRGFDSTALSVVGAGTGANRLIRLYDYIGVNVAPVSGIALALVGDAATSSTTYSAWGSSVLRFKQGTGEESNAGILSYKIVDSTALSIIGSGTSASNRLVRIYDRIGINAAPSTAQTLNVDGTGSTYAAIFQNGNVGIGTTAPGAKLEIKSPGTSQYPFRIVQSSSTNNIFEILEGAAGAGNLNIYDASNVLTTRFSGGVNGNSYFNSGGNVGIGTAAPGYKLDVAGDINYTGGIYKSGVRGVPQADLKTTTHTITRSRICDGTGYSSGNYAMNSGSYGFWPTIRVSANCRDANSYVGIDWAGKDVYTATTTPYIYLGIASNENTSLWTTTAEATQTYIQASPPYYIDGVLISRFIYIIWNKTNNFIESVSDAEDPPWEYTGKIQEKSPHPFPDFYYNALPADKEIAMINPENASQWQEEAKKKNISLATYLNQYMRVDPAPADPPISPDTAKPIRIQGNVVWRNLIPQTSEKIQIADQAVAGAEIEKMRQNKTITQPQAADLAEKYPAAPFLAPGDIVESIKAHINDDEANDPLKKDNLLLVKSKTPYSSKVMGVISTNPAQILNAGGDDGQLPLALAGRVPTKITTTNGKIFVGDSISSTSIAGVGAKTLLAGTIVGKALEEFDCNSVTDCKDSLKVKFWIDKDGNTIVSENARGEIYPVAMIEIFVNLSWYDPDVYLTTTGGLQIIQKPAPTSPSAEYVYSGNLDSPASPLFSLISPTGEIIGRVAAFSEAAVANLRAGFIQAEKITTKSLTSLTAQIAQIVTNRLTVTERIISPIVETTSLTAQTAQINQIAANEIKPQNEDLTINLGNTPEVSSSSSPNLPNPPDNPNAGALAKLIIKGLAGKTAAVIDAEGNATFSGSLTSLTSLTAPSLSVENATISGTLAAQQISTNFASASELISTNFQTETASISGKLIAKEIESDNINEIQRLLAEIKNQPLPNLTNETNLSNITNLTEFNTPEVSSSSSNNPTSGVVSSSSSNSVIPSKEGIQSINTSEQGNFSLDSRLHGNDTIDQLTVSGSSNLYNVSVSGSLLIGATMIENNSILSLASDLKLSSLGTITLFDGTVVIAKDGTITTQATLIAQGLTIKNPAGDEVASIDASGSAKFNNLAINNLTIENKYLDATRSGAIIAATDNFAKNGLFAPAIETATASAGLGRLPAESLELVIYNSLISPLSFIYLTPTSANFTGQLTVTKKAQGYFVVSTTLPQATDITFDWLIIN